MPELTLEALAKRVEALEKKLAEQETGKKDWRGGIGMSDGDPEFIPPVLVTAEPNPAASSE